MSEINWNSTELIDFNWDRINIYNIDYSFSWILYITFLIMIYFEYMCVFSIKLLMYYFWVMYNFCVQLLEIIFYLHFFFITFVTDMLEHYLVILCLHLTHFVNIVTFNNFSKSSYWLILMQKKYIFASLQCLNFLFSQNLVRPPKKCGIEMMILVTLAWFLI